MATVAERIIAEVGRRAGQSEAGLAKSIFSVAAYQQRVNSTCRRLISEGILERRGSGGRADPYRYYLVRR